MKILQVIPYFVPAWDYGGPVQVCYELSKELGRKPHSVTIYTTDTLNPKERIKEKEEVINGIKVKRFRNLNKLLAYNQKIFLSPSMVSVIRNNLKDFDVVHLHEYRTIQNIIVHHYAKKYNIPYVLQAHGSLTTFFQRRWLKRTFDAIWGYGILKDASKVIAVTKAEAKQYKSMGISEDKIEVIPNGIDLSEFDNLPQRGEFRRKYGLNDNQKIILYLGRIHQTKGLDLLTKAFAQLSSDAKDVKLVIVGPDDGYLPALKELIKELKIEGKVVFTGPLYGTDKLGAYVDADVFVNPRADEIFGLVFLEAFACGTPVICSKGCGIADVIDGQAGLVVPYNKEQLQHALLQMLGDDKMRQEFGKCGKSLVQEHFSWPQIARRMEKIYYEKVREGVS